MSITYKRKPTFINAIKFEGGVDNATRIIEWVGMASGRSAAWIPGLPQFQAPNGVVVEATPERLMLNPGSNSSIDVPIGHWVTISVSENAYTISPEEFERDYEVE